METIQDDVPLRRRAAGNGVANDGRDRRKHGPSSSDQVIAAVKHGIREGRYVAGQRLIEADLTRDYGLSRGPIREALKRLATRWHRWRASHSTVSIRASTPRNARTRRC